MDLCRALTRASCRRVHSLKSTLRRFSFFLSIHLSPLPIDLPCVEEFNRTDMEGKTEVSIGLKNVEKDIDDSKVEIKKLEVKLDGTSDPHERIELNRRLTAKEQRLTSLTAGGEEHSPET